jgi:hypothetical protein
MHLAIVSPAASGEVTFPDEARQGSGADNILTNQVPVQHDNESRAYGPVYSISSQFLMITKSFADAQAEADPLRHDLLFGSGDILKDAGNRCMGRRFALLNPACPIQPVTANTSL